MQGRVSALLDGDGRRMLYPRNAPVGTRPIAVRRFAARRLVGVFEKDGRTYHSPAGALVWLVVAYCREQGYNHLASCGGPGTVDVEQQGWVVERLP